MEVFTELTGGVDIHFGNEDVIFYTLKCRKILKLIWELSDTFISEVYINFYRGGALIS